MIKQEFNVSILETDNYTIVKAYKKPILVPDNRGKTGIRGQAQDKFKSVYNSLKRAKKSIYEYAIANQWDLWGTLTLDKVKINRYDIDEIQKTLTIYLMNKRISYRGLKWLIVPENHKDGAWHFHLLLTGLPYEELRDIGKTYKDTGRKMFNWINYEQNFGWNSFIDIADMPLDEMYKISNYLTKYMTKDVGALRFNKKKYWSSRGLKRPNKTNKLLTYEEYVDLMQLESGFIDDIILQNEYSFKDKVTGEIRNTVTETVKMNLPF